MEIGPIFRAMLRNKVGAGLITLQLTLTLVIVLNAMGIVSSNMGRLDIPSGIVEQELLTIQSQSPGERYKDPVAFRQVVDADLAKIRAYPGVKDVCLISPLPLQGGGSSGQRIPMGGSAADAVRTPRFTVDTHFLDTMGLKLEAGRTFIDSDIPPLLTDEEQAALTEAPVTNVIVTRALADTLFPNGDALGKMITDNEGNNPETIVGIVTYMYTPYDNGASGMEHRIIFLPGKPASAEQALYMVRMEDSAYQTAFTGLETALSQEQPDRLFSTTGMMEIKQRGTFVNRFAIGVLTALIALLVFVTALGIYGMTSFSVETRTRQIGTRRALGATKGDILRYFLVEISLLSGVGICLGLALGLPLNQKLVTQINGLTPVSLSIALACMAGLLVVSLGSAAIPAHRAAAIPPVIATRSV